MRSPPFEPTCRRRKVYPSQMRIRRGIQIVHGSKKTGEKLGRNDLCPCGSGQLFREVLPEERPLSEGANRG